jgi:hypothetical protein
MADRYAVDIRRIVGFDETKSELGPAKERDKIRSKRGFATVSTKEEPNDPREQNVQDEDGAKAKERGEQSTTIKKLLGDEDDRPSIGDEVNTLEGFYDCDTGKELIVRLDGLDQPPEGWQSATDNGEANDVFVPGEYYNHSIFISSPVGISGNDLERPAPNDDFLTEYEAFAYMESVTFPIFTNKVFVSKVILPPPNYARIDTYNLPDYPLLFGQPSQLRIGSSRLMCPGSNFCALTEDPRVEDVRWTPDGVTQIVYRDGKFQQSEFEPDEERINKYNQPFSTLEVCYDDEGVEKVAKLFPTKDGGFILSDLDNQGAIPGGNNEAVLLGPDLKIRGFTTGSTVSRYLPGNISVF